jgi:hypothetical protein
MNHIAGKALPALSNLALAGWKAYLPILGCFGFVSLALFVVSSLGFYR